MVNCPSYKQESQSAKYWAEVTQAKELENRKHLGDYIIFICPRYKRKGLALTILSW